MTKSEKEFVAVSHWQPSHILGRSKRRDLHVLQKNGNVLDMCALTRFERMQKQSVQMNCSHFWVDADHSK